jgi:hypothetical protein
MTSIEKLQNHTSPSLENAKFLQAGFMKLAVPPGTDDINAAMLEQGALEVLCAMITLGSAAEKSFSRRRLKQFIAAGKRLAAAKAKSVPKSQGDEL